MAATADELPEENNLFVGHGVAINGAVMTSGTVVVHGVLEGDISVTNLFVGETGTIKGRIDVAQKAEIFGKAFERLSVKGLLVLRAGCRVDGNVSFGTLQIEQGASITGGISAANQAGGGQAATAHGPAEQPAPEVARKETARAANGAAAAAGQRFDLSALGLAPNPVSAAG
jgi:cytoskeletal protein CcmA (bactofilin family)